MMAMFDQYDLSIHPDCYRAAKSVVGWCEAAHSGKSPALLLWGGCGVGKTHLAQAAEIALTWHYRGNGKEQVYGRFGEIIPQIVSGLHGAIITTDSMLDIIRSNYEKNISTTKSIAQIFDDCEFVIIDDFGAEHVGKNSQEWFYTVTQKLVEYLKDRIPTLITTNVHKNSQPAFFGPRAYSRLVDWLGKSGFVGMSHLPDYRLTRAAKL